MKQVTLTIILSIISFFAIAQDTIQLELIETKYQWIGEGPAPSCGLMRARAKQRQKLIRELSHYIESLPEDYDDFLIDSYLLNRYFLDFKVWNDETIEVTHRWKVNSDDSQELFAKKDVTFFGLESDGISWVDKTNFFPEEVHFEFIPEKLEIVTHHTTYYVDYCSPRKKPYLDWYSDPNLDLTTTMERVNRFVESIHGDLK